jgi:hypothetical protein
MEHHQFDVLTRSISRHSSRRDVLRGLVAGCGLGMPQLAETVTAKKKKRKKRKPQQPQPRCSPGEQLDAIGVPGTGEGVLTRILAEGQGYRLRASGFWNSNATHGQDAFADFELANPDNSVTDFEGVRLGLSINGGSPDQWGSYHTNHVYERIVTGQGMALSLKCSDKVFTDNSGEVLVEVFCV